MPSVSSLAYRIAVLSELAQHGDTDTVRRNACQRLEDIARLPVAVIVPGWDDNDEISLHEQII